MFSLFNETAYYWYYLRRSFIWRGGGFRLCHWTLSVKLNIFNIFKDAESGLIGSTHTSNGFPFWATCTKYMYMNLCALWWNLIFLFNVYISPLLGNQNIQRKRNLDIRWQRYKPLNNKALVRNLVYSLKMATKGTKLM